MKVTDLKDDELVKIFVELRDRRAMRKAAFENEDSGDKSKQEKIEVILLQRFQEGGHESVRTAYGTAYKTTKTYVSIADPEIFMNYIRENEAWELLTKAANKTAVKQYKDANGDIPPGLNWREEVTIGVQRAS